MGSRHTTRPTPEMTLLSPARRISNLSSVPGGNGVGVFTKMPPLLTSCEWFSMNSSTVALFVANVQADDLRLACLYACLGSFGPLHIPTEARSKRQHAAKKRAKNVPRALPFQAQMRPFVVISCATRWPLTRESAFSRARTTSGTPEHHAPERACRLGTLGNRSRSAHRRADRDR